ncbi:MAG TPA: 30S ribosomal protein S6 [Candidatus Gracilibacteria bacterium]|nr:30S ribosomal protein S6 [Candidatus Gracilibacteria bacterium]
MNPYELMVIINPDIGGDATTKRLDEIRKLITGPKGEIFFEDLWGLRDLSYTIKKRDRGFYTVFNFNIEPGMIKEMDMALRLDNEVLRHMIISLPAGYEPKTLKKREEEAEVEAAKAQEEKDEKAAKKPMARRIVKKEEPVVEAKKTAPKKAEGKEEPTLEEVDAKLRSIIDNPDINF